MQIPGRHASVGVGREQSSEISSRPPAPPGHLSLYLPKHWALVLCFPYERTIPNVIIILPVSLKVSKYTGAMPH